MRHNKKSLIVSFLTLIFILTFVSCGKANEDLEPDVDVKEEVIEEPTVEPTEEAEPVKEDRNYMGIYNETGELVSLRELYEGKIRMGVALSEHDIQGEKAELVASQFNSLTCENEMKPDFILDRNASIAQGDEEVPAIKMDRAMQAIRFAEENDLKIRYHTLVWHAQTPDWFFNVAYDNSEDAERVTRDVMIARLENYIRLVMEYFNENHPGLIYAWDVVNEAISPGDGREDGIRVADNNWFEVIGPDYIELAFTFARKYAEPDQKLFYNDFQTYDKNKMYYIVNLIKGLQEKDIIDGIGMQDHMDMTNPGLLDYQYTLNRYASLGLEIQVTELDINTDDNSEEGQMKLAARYKGIMTIILDQIEKDRANITSITFWGLTDDRSWLNNPDEPKYPLLFDKELQPKPALFGVAMDDSISIRN